MRLVLMRHGIAAELHEMPTPDDGRRPRDADRPLTEEGRRKVRKAAKALRALGVKPDAVMHSGLVRARETAELVAARLKPRAPELLVTDTLESDADPDDFFERVADLRVQTVVAVGHAPHLDFAVAIGCGLRGRLITELGKAAAACLELPDPGLPPGRLVWLLPPALLRRLA